MAQRAFGKLRELTAAEKAESTVHTSTSTALTAFNSFICHDLPVYLTTPYSARCEPAARLLIVDRLFKGLAI
jgi:hypothetical protein